jgi:hypothetical protein
MSKWNLRNTLTALNYSRIKALYKDHEGKIEKGSYGTDAVGRSQYVATNPDKVVFVTFSNGCYSGELVEPHEIKLKINNQIIDLSSLKDDPDAYFVVHALIATTKKAECKFCGGDHISRCGKNRHGKQRYLCVDCKKRFV